MTCDLCHTDIPDGAETYRAPGALSFSYADRTPPHVVDGTACGECYADNERERGEHENAMEMRGDEMRERRRG